MLSFSGWDRGIRGFGAGGGTGMAGAATEAEPVADAVRYRSRARKARNVTPITATTATSTGVAQCGLPTAWVPDETASLDDAEVWVTDEPGPDAEPCP